MFTHTNPTFHVVYSVWLCLIVHTDRNFDETIACFAEPFLDSPLFSEASTTSLYEEESTRVSGPNQGEIGCESVDSPVI